VSIGSFGDTPNARLPLQALTIDTERLKALGSSGLAALPLLDASISDSYNSLGYWASLKVRGFDVDNRFNLRRDGLPVSGETGYELFNKAAVEVLKGTSGLQAGVSSPAGLINLLTKRPDANRLDLQLGWEQPGTWSATLDWAQRGKAFGWRLNATSARLDPWLKKAQGERQGLALAADWTLGSDTLLEAELEATHQSQPSQPGFSLLGDRLPSLAEFDRRRNLNDAAWRLPVVFDNRFASLRLTQRLNADWSLQLQAGLQRARTDDRIAFPFGCFAADTYDRYCADGSFDLYDFRSENERRDTDSARALLTGRIGDHQLRIELLSSRFQAGFQRQAYNYAGSGSVFGPDSSAADPTLTDENTNRRERSTELGLSDQVRLGDLELFAGLRWVQARRAAVRTDGSRPTDYTKRFTTPWLGASWALAPDLRVYASTGQGIETEVAPNRARYSNAGESLVLKSRQHELGIKAGSRSVDWSLAAFEVTRPAWSDVGSCSANGSCRRVADGEARHRGLEAQADLKWPGGGLLGSAMWLQARRLGAADAALNGKRPTNVPAQQFRLALRQQLLAGVEGSAALVHEGRRAVLPDNSLSLPAWTRLDLGLRADLGASVRWRIGIDNLTNRSAWKESPYQFGHVYLYPLAPRTVRTSLELAL
jgi:iron complex outermembrane receptor protein